MSVLHLHRKEAAYPASFWYILMKILVFGTYWKYFENLSAEWSFNTQDISLLSKEY